LGLHLLIRDTQGNITPQKVKLSVSAEILLKNNASAFFFLGRARVNTLKGSLERVMKEAIPRLLWRTKSPSLVAKQIYAALAQIFNFKANSKFTKSSKSDKLGKELKIFIKTSKKLFVNFDYDKTVPKFSGKNRLRKRKNPVKLKPNLKVTRITQQTQNILPIINANIRQYMLQEMTQGNALRNRSGVFASSVRALGAEEDVVQYTYESDPYKLFENPPVGRINPKTGKRADPAPFYVDRKPSVIIDKAIKRIGQDKFGKVFRTQKV
jgi:hypothetical protein